jgi:hypothetical protein
LGTGEYYFTEMQAWDAATNSSAEVSWWNVRDTQGPVSSTVSNDADLDGGDVEVFQTLTTDNLDIKAFRAFVGFGADRVDFGSTNVGAFGPDDYTRSATLTAQFAWLGAYQQDIAGALVNADAVDFDITDFGANLTNVTGTTVAANEYSAANPMTRFNVGTSSVRVETAAGAVSYGTGMLSLCADLLADGCVVATSVTSVTVSLTITGDGSGVADATGPLLNPFRKVIFLARKTDDAAAPLNDWYELGQGVMSVTEGVGGDPRTYTYSTSLAGSLFTDTGTFTIWGFGLDADGRGFRATFTVLVTED